MMAIPPLAPVSQMRGDTVPLTCPEKLYPELVLRQGGVGRSQSLQTERLTTVPLGTHKNARISA